MTTTAALICLFWLSVFGGNLFVGLLHRRSRRRAEEVRRRERIRAGFADARTGIVWAALRGELDPDSATFHQMYYATTASMRRDDQYGNLWQEVLMSLQRASRGRSGVKAEAPSWSPAVRNSVLQFVSTVDLLLIEHSPRLRWIHRFNRLTSRAPHPPLVTWLRRFFEAMRVEEERQRRLAPARQVESLLKDAAGCLA